MIQFTGITGLASSALATVAVVVMLPGVARIPKPCRIALACAVALAALTPFDGLPLAAYVRGMTGDLSIASLILLLSALLNRLTGWQPLEAQSRLVLLLLVALAALWLYPMALGIGSFDPYRAGYGNLWFMAALLATALAACFRQFPVLALAIALAVFAWSIGWYESANLWDYLLDPLLASYATGALMKRGIQMQRERQQQAIK